MSTRDTIFSQDDMLQEFPLTWTNVLWFPNLVLQHNHPKKLYNTCLFNCPYYYNCDILHIVQLCCTKSYDEISVCVDAPLLDL